MIELKSNALCIFCSEYILTCFRKDKNFEMKGLMFISDSANDWHCMKWYLMACMNSEDPDQPVHSYSLIQCIEPEEYRK